jgi:hypothetical protein
MTPHTQLWTGSPYGSCFATAVASVLDLPLSAVPNFVAFRSGRWWDALLLWCKSQRLHMERRSNDGDPLPAGQAVIASGKGPRGPRHAVVWQDDRMVHDPHPDRTGLVGEPDGFYVFTRCEDKDCPRCDGGDVAP